ncbi:hypothetical protein GCM10023185_06860 [Hymenobacter saemangeumensis]|uniref:Uncharacterized protein n=1 Tax=Hymenobacter saemangeumensis TaxID=1084522 RepID=A0ABP8I2L9_9BACT
MPKAKKKTPSKADHARACAAMRALGVATLYGNGDGHYFRTSAAAAQHNGGDTKTLITYSLD